VVVLMVTVAGLATGRVRCSLPLAPDGSIITYYVVIPSTEYRVLLIMITDDSVLGAS
jgi:hypothetical protein